MVQPRLKHVGTAVTIGGVYFPVSRWSVSLASQGTMSTATAEGSLSFLIASGVDIIDVVNEEETGNVEFEVFAGYDGELKKVFFGVIDGTHFDVDNDHFEIRGRDLSALLADGKQTVAGLKYKNQSVSQIVEQIGEKFNFKTEVEEADTMAGPEMNGEHHFNPHPQSYWSLLQSLAENTGSECFMRPDGTLYFGPGKKQNSMIVNYGAPRDAQVDNPGWGLTFDYEPRNNSKIKVKALSYEPQKAKTVTASAEAKSLKLGNLRKHRTSKHGRSPRQVSSKNTKIKSKNKSIYYIRCAGLTPDQAQKKCQAVADSLAKRQLIVGCSIEGNVDMEIHTEVTIEEHTISVYKVAGVPLDVSEVTHEFTMPDDGDSSGGLITSFRAMAQVEE